MSAIEVMSNVLEQHGAGDHLAGVLHQVFEQPELARLQINSWSARATRWESRSSSGRRPYTIPRGCRGGRQHLDAAPAARRTNRLRQVVVTARPQPLDAVVDLASERGSAPRLDALAAERADDGEAVELRQHTVDDQHVVLTVEPCAKPSSPSRRGPQRVDLAKRLREVIGDPGRLR